MFCVNCGKRLERTWGHCSNCGAKIEQPQSSTVSVTQNPYKSSSSKSKFGCGSLVLVLIVAGLISSTFSANQNVATQPSDSSATTKLEKLSLEEAIDKALGVNASAKQLAALNCGQFDAYTPEFFQGLAKDVPKVLPSYQKIKEPRKALAFIEDNNLQQTNFLLDYQNAFQSGVSAILKVVEDEIDFTIYEKSTQAWVADMSDAVLAECETLGEYPKVLRQVTELQDELDRVRSLSANVPWYPDGYYEYADGLTAWKWANRSCSYYSGSCWHVDVIPKLGCQNLYVEINIFDSSNSVIDFSNDTARSVQAGQVAKLEFVSFSDAADTGQVVNISCY